MIFYKLRKTFLDRLFELKDKELKHLHVFLISDNKLEQASEWKKITEFRMGNKTFSGKSTNKNIFQ